ncbi:MAG: alpha-glucuronidase [Bacteroidaceae bacterium]|nr:alpha-glucuronidase [Bacteroidaceae bacterium]MBO5951289.1 alpha-glucuronidase [Bacteroidaceae bacterium]
MMKTFRTSLLSIAFLGLLSCNANQTVPTNTDGHNLWFNSLGEEQTLSPTKTTMAILQNELNNHWEGKQVVNVKLLGQRNEELGNEGYVIDYNADSVVIFANTQVAALYGTYDLIRMQESGQLGKKAFSKTELPAFHNRILNHWDNPNGTIERGYAGKSLWKWNELPDKISPVYEEYARANASIGINGTVLNNVNADPKMLTAEYLQKVKVLADIFRPYGLKVYLSLNFASPKHLANLKTSDPLDKDVIKWWNDKVKEIYSIIPDFGGFLVKANSEGQSGPQDYGRTHADGANMIADAVAPYGGIVMWRAFVYDAQSPDRAKQACEEFVRFDGQFRDNVIIQIKNGPVDFQPREPFSPLFGQLENTNVMAEFQITQEYLGFSNHLVYLHPMWKECLDSDTYQKGEGSTVAEITKGVTHSRPINAIAGVTNIGDSINWCGHHFAQSNWYAYGRMAWNPELSSEQIADEWIKQTFSSEKKFIEPVKNMMLMSRETNVKYEMPLGLHHIFSGQGHYGPGPWEGASRPDWSPLYYHKAAKDGIGFDRTMNGSAAVEQYHEPLKSLYNNVETCPENLILWFHHLPWDYKMKSGRTLWDELCYTYQEGIDEAASFIKVWESVEKYVDSQRYENIHRKIVRQAKDAIWWRDACMLYFQTFSGMPIPEDCTAPQHTLEELRRVRLGISNYETPALEKLPAYELK